MNIGEERFKPIHTVKVQKHVVFASAMPLQDLEHGWFEVIVDDRARDPAPEFKGMTLAEQKSALCAALGSTRQTSLPKNGAAQRETAL